MTVVLGIYFSLLQALEYIEAEFRVADSAFGASFFLATGFHGFHVVVGSGFLAACLSRIGAGRFREIHHFGFEAAA